MRPEIDNVKASSVFAVNQQRAAAKLDVRPKLSLSMLVINSAKFASHFLVCFVLLSPLYHSH